MTDEEFVQVKEVADNLLQTSQVLSPANAMIACLAAAAGIAAVIDMPRDKFIEGAKLAWNQLAEMKRNDGLH
jgi:hypothetical protein